MPKPKPFPKWLDDILLERTRNIDGIQELTDEEARAPTMPEPLTFLECLRQVALTAYDAGEKIHGAEIDKRARALFYSQATLPGFTKRKKGKS